MNWRLITPALAIVLLGYVTIQTALRASSEPSTTSVAPLFEPKAPISVPDASVIPSSSGNWQQIGSDYKGAKVYIDTQTLTRTGETARYWQRIDYPPGDPHRIVRFEFYLSVNCRTGKTMNLKTIAQDTGGQVASFDKSSTDTIVPGTLAGSAFSAACRP